MAAASGASATKAPPSPAGTKPKCPECGKAYHHSSSTCSKARKPKVSGKVAGDLAPKRPPAKNERVARSVGVCLSLTQQLVFTVRPDLVEDQLSPYEFQDLSYALADELLSWDFLVRWFAEVAGAAVHIRLGIVVVGIAIPRLVRHGVIPPELAMQFMVGAADAAGAFPEPAENGHQAVPQDPIERAVMFDQLEIESGVPGGA